MVGSDAGGHGEFEILGFGKTFGGQVAGVEAVVSSDQLMSMILEW